MQPTACDVSAPGAVSAEDPPTTRRLAAATEHSSPADTVLADRPAATVPVGWAATAELCAVADVRCPAADSGRVVDTIGGSAVAAVGRSAIGAAGRLGAVCGRVASAASRAAATAGEPTAATAGGSAAATADCPAVVAAGCPAVVAAGCPVLADGPATSDDPSAGATLTRAATPATSDDPSARATLTRAATTEPCRAAAAAEDGPLPTTGRTAPTTAGPAASEDRSTGAGLRGHQSLNVGSAAQRNVPSSVTAHAAWIRASFVACRAAKPNRRASANSSRTRRFCSRRARQAAICAACRSCHHVSAHIAPTPTSSQTGTTKPPSSVHCGQATNEGSDSAIGFPVPSTGFHELSPGSTRECQGNIRRSGSAPHRF